MSITQVSHKRNACLRWPKTNVCYRRPQISCTCRSRNQRSSSRTSILRWINVRRGLHRVPRRTTEVVTTAAAVVVTRGNRLHTCHRHRPLLRRLIRAAAVWAEVLWVAVHHLEELLRMLMPKTHQPVAVVRRGGHQSTGSISKVPTHRWEVHRERCYSSRTFTRRETFTGGRRCLFRRHRTRHTIGWSHRRRTTLPADR